jgi:hypothetical protein
MWMKWRIPRPPRRRPARSCRVVRIQAGVAHAEVGGPGGGGIGIGLQAALRLMVRAANAMLSFVNEHTREKFVITDDLDLVCIELGWDANEVGMCEGGVKGHMKKHLRHGSSLFSITCDRRDTTRRDTTRLTREK